LKILLDKIILYCIISVKGSHMKKVAVYIFYFLMMLFVFFSNLLFAQQTNNLEVIWERGVVDSLYHYYGFDLGSGDFNGDGFSDIVVQGNLRPYPGISQAYIFFGGNPFDTIPDVIITSDTTWGFIRTRGIGDINGDGFDDLALGSQLGVPAGYGSVYIYSGGNPMDTICDFHIVGFGGSFGYAVGSGDVNGDGYSDVIVGAYMARVAPGLYAGRVYIYYGGANFDTVPDVILNGGHHNDVEGFGSTVASGGDVNGDGISDVIIGAANFGQIIQGRIYIYFGGNPMDTLYDVAMSGEGAWHSLGFNGVDFLINRDDYDYAITGTQYWGGSGYLRGKIYVLFGGPNMDSIPDIWITGRADTSSLGLSLCNAGFTNNIESSDLFAGAPGDYGYLGSAYLWLGGALLDTIPDSWISGPDVMGFCVASAGDVDGDGRDEIIVSNYPTMGESAKMRVWVCKYTGTGVEEIASPRLAMTSNVEVYPNPARSVVRVRCPFSVKEIKVYDVSGKLIKTLDKVDSRQNTEYREIRWNLRDENKKRVANGIYFIELVAEQENEKIREIRKITIVK